MMLYGLMAAQALALSSAPLMILIGGLLGSRLHSDPSLSTLPIAAMIVGMAVAVLPVAHLSARFGRRAVSSFAMLLGVGACGLAFWSVSHASFWGFTFAGAMFGMVGAVVQQFRFLAMSSVPESEHARVASRLLLAGLVSAFLGPQLSVLSDVVPEWDYGAPFVGLAACFTLASVIVWLVVPASAGKQSASSDHQSRSWSILLAQPDLWLAMSAAAVGYAVMAFVMTATPLSMTALSGHELHEARWTIQSHIAAMFLPSLFSGALIKKVGHYAVVWMGLLIFVLSLAIGAFDDSLLHYWLALLLLGIGWNFLFVSGTALLASCYRPADAARVQGMNDMLVFGMQATASLCSGAVLLLWGWSVLLTIAALALVWLALVLVFAQRRRTG